MPLVVLYPPHPECKYGSTPVDVDLGHPVEESDVPALLAEGWKLSKGLPAITDAIADEVSKFLDEEDPS
jgi:hypothetical protein